MLFAAAAESSSFCSESQCLMRAELSVAEIEVRLQPRTMREVDEARRLRTNTIAMVATATLNQTAYVDLEDDYQATQVLCH